MPKYSKPKFLLETKLRTIDYAHKEKGLDKGKDHYRVQSSPFGKSG